MLERFMLAGAVLLLPTLGARAATPSQNNLVPGAAMASACVGNGFPGIGHSGDAVNLGVSTSSGSAPTAQALNCVLDASGVGGTAQTGAQIGGGVFGPNAYNNSATASATAGLIKLQSGNHGSFGDDFSGGGAQGGWNDTFIPLGGGPIGTTGLLAFTVHADGDLAANGLGASAQTFIEIYQDHGSVQPYADALHAAAYNKFLALNTGFNAALNHNSVAEGTILFGWDYEMKPFGAVDYDNGSPDSLSTHHLVTNEDVTFVLPVTWGTAFSLGVYAAVDASETSSGGSSAFPANDASADFHNTVFWTGDYYGLAADGTGPPLPGVRLTSASGIDYNQNFGPTAAVSEPASLLLLAGGLGSLGLLMRRRATRIG
jgi:hypothetical protein